MLSRKRPRKPALGSEKHSTTRYGAVLPGRPFFVPELMQSRTKGTTKRPDFRGKVNGLLLGFAKQGRNWAKLRQLATNGGNTTKSDAGSSPESVA